MKKSIILLLLAWLYYTAPAQVSVNTDGAPPDPSAGLDIKFTDKGVLLPRLTKSQILAISNPADGLIVFCTTSNKLYIFNAALSQWKEIAYGPGTLWECGDSLTKTHVAGTVAPVDKTVTYGTVKNIPGEPSKCWITSNLGADHQATAKDDATEPSAGWYWQFNRKQGYKHDGSTVTPGNTWIVYIYENSDWLAVNDPCTLELGPNWHIPTMTEWNNVRESGGWNNWNGPWNSALKLHAAGFLFGDFISLWFRGSDGFYWSSSQFLASDGFNLRFNISFANIESWNSKVKAMTLRCLRD